MSDLNHCPKAEDIVEIKTELRLLKVQVKNDKSSLSAEIRELKKYIIENTTSRIYEEGRNAGRKEGASKIVSYVGVGINALSRIIAVSIVLGALIAVGNTVGAVEFVAKFLGFK